MALYEEFKSHVLLCQVHSQLPLYKAFTWYVDRVAKKLDVKTVKVADLLAPVGTPCYYYHSRTGPAKDEIPSARDQLVAMWKTWINTNTNRVGHCDGGKAGRVENGGPPLSTRAVREGGNSAAHDLPVIAAKRLGFSGIGVAWLLPIGI